MYKKLILTFLIASFALASNNNGQAQSSKHNAAADTKLSVVQTKKKNRKQRKKFLFDFIAAITEASNNSAAIDTSKLLFQSNNTAIADTSKSELKKLLDFTALPRQVQKLVLQYASSGWLKSDAIKWEDDVYDLYFYKDSQLVGAIKQSIKPIFFDSQVSKERAAQIEKELSVLQWKETPDIRTISPNRMYTEYGCATVYSKNYCALQHSCVDIIFKKLNNAAASITERIVVPTPGAKNLASTLYPSCSYFSNALLNNIIMKMCFSKDEHYFALSKSYGVVYVYDLITGKLIAHIEKQDANALEFFPDNKYLLLGGGGNFIALVNLASGEKVIIQQLQIDQRDSYIRALACSPDGDYFVSANDKGDITKFELDLAI